MNKIALVFITILGLFSCTGKFGADSSSSAGDSAIAADLAALKSTLASAGLSEAEIAAIADAINAAAATSAASGFQSKLTSLSDEETAKSRAREFTEAGYSAFNSEVFTSQSRKEEVAEIVAGEVAAHFGLQLADSGADDLAELLTGVFEKSFDVCGYVGSSSTEKISAIKKVIKRIIKEAGELKDDKEFRMAFATKLGKSIVGSIQKKSCLSETGDIESAVPEILASAVLGLEQVSTADGTEKVDLSSEIISNSLAGIKEAGLTEAQISNVTDGIGTGLTAIAGQLTSISAGQLAIIKEVGATGATCNESSQYAYMYEYSDSRCQTLTRKFIEGPLLGSPLGKGFPNFRFCFRNDANGLYYNWVGTSAGCGPKPEVTSIPAEGPSPRTNSVNFIDGSYSCKWGMLSGAMGASDGGKLSCESNAMLNFINNQVLLEVKVSDVVSSSFDAANGYSFPFSGKLCKILSGTSTSAMHAYFVASKNECINFCEKVMSAWPESDFGCQFAGTLIKYYAVNELLEKSNELHKLVTVKPVNENLSRGSCRGLQVAQKDSNGDPVADIIRVSVSSSKQLVGTEYQGIATYSDSACLVPVTHVLLAPNEVKTIYVKVASNATKVSIYVNTADNFVDGMYLEYDYDTFTGITDPIGGRSYCPAAEGYLSPLGYCVYY